ncbi:hypothetical protein M8C13_38555 [Crossiella sp. SN42]|nr:hypothetical protein [Crossiella sp. SN42]MCO1581667.1 hypothetical protein [Crossiella sp. SN42]
MLTDRIDEVVPVLGAVGLLAVEERLVTGIHDHGAQPGERPQAEVGEMR